jgi:hypothetical protein
MLNMDKHSLQPLNEVIRRSDMRNLTHSLETRQCGTDNPEIRHNLALLMWRFLSLLLPLHQFLLKERDRVHIIQAR